MIGRNTILVDTICAAVGVGLGSHFAQHDGIDVPLVAEAEAAGGKVSDPKGVAPDRYVYYPGTEALGAERSTSPIAADAGTSAAAAGRATGAIPTTAWRL